MTTRHKAKSNKDSRKSKGTRKMPDKMSAQNSQLWVAPTCKQEGQESSEHVKGSSVRNAQHMKQRFQSEKSDDRGKHENR